MTKNEKQRFIAADELLKLRNYHNQTDTNTSRARIKAGKRFLNLGIPLNKDEYWKFCSPARFTSKDLITETNFYESNVTKTDDPDETNLFFVDGVLDTSLSDSKLHNELDIVKLGIIEQIRVRLFHQTYKYPYWVKHVSVACITV